MDDCMGYPIETTGGKNSSTCAGHASREIQETITDGYGESDYNLWKAIAEWGGGSTLPELSAI